MIGFKVPTLTKMLSKLDLHNHLSVSLATSEKVATFIWNALHV